MAFGGPLEATSSAMRTLEGMEEGEALIDQSKENGALEGR